GSDRERDARNQAKKQNAVDEIESYPADAARNASLVVVATPVRSIRSVFEEIAPHLTENTVVTDTGSTKAEVMRWAAEILPAGVSFVGGHPMAGKETAGAGAAEAGLFRAKIYCVMPSVSATESAVRTVLGLIQTL